MQEEKHGYAPRLLLLRQNTPRSIRLLDDAGQIPPEMRFDVEELLGDFDVSFIDGLWIALVAVEAVIILCVLGYRVLLVGNRKTGMGMVSFSMPAS
ncbi:hypothetical protein EKO27_g4779 [Xylaria grammica]|uniref:Uncharacterized protein n=1 Tax=Xylaria grammica TaxID=363999 RepID=A0A439D7F0_9PEZI|nr:hypothetical protein EKO27_g4779 [Xylaria grammica]